MCLPVGRTLSKPESLEQTQKGNKTEKKEREFTGFLDALYEKRRQSLFLFVKKAACQKKKKEPFEKLNPRSNKTLTQLYFASMELDSLLPPRLRNVSSTARI